ncbi:hypothetical protein [Microbacterium hibisci]|uniref:hypothetical protein n=1 Tax=Microbacterium hibisci TaxID=2036000 RepID=UPI001943C26A|nr:hypothetical protein [Microbacterium hibisci]
MQVCYWARERGELLREDVDRVPVAGEILSRPELGVTGQVVECVPGADADGTEEVRVEVALASA